MDKVTPPIPLITSDDGFKARIKNPFDIMHYRYDQFEQTVEWLPLTIQQEANKEIMGHEVWQAQIYGDKEWETMPPTHKPINAMGVQNRKAYQPIPSVSEKPTLKEGIESVEDLGELINLCIQKFTGSGLPADVREMYINGAKFGSEWQAKQSGLISREKVIDILHEYITSIPQMSIHTLLDKIKNL